MEVFYTIKAGFKIILDVLLFFFYSFCTIFFTIFMIKVSSEYSYSTIFTNKEIIISFLATIPTFLIGIHNTTNAENKNLLKKFLFFFILISIVLFIFMTQAKNITDINTIINTTYFLLFLSFIFTFLSQFNLDEFLSDIETQKKAEKSKNKVEKTFSNGKKVTF